jgi:hypothetical protein
MTLELQITSEDYYYLTCDNITSIPLGAKDYPLQLWQTVEVWSSDREERMRVYVTGISPVPEAGAVVVKLERLQYEWIDYPEDYESRCLINDGILQLKASQNMRGFWNANLDGRVNRFELNLPSKIAAQLAAEGLLKQLTIDLCRLHGAILYYP